MIISESKTWSSFCERAADEQVSLNDSPVTIIEELKPLMENGVPVVPLKLHNYIDFLQAKGFPHHSWPMALQVVSEADYNLESFMLHPSKIFKNDRFL